MQLRHNCNCNAPSCQLYAKTVCVNPSSASLHLCILTLGSSLFLNDVSDHFSTSRALMSAFYPRPVALFIILNYPGVVACFVDNYQSGTPCMQLDLINQPSMASPGIVRARQSSKSRQNCLSFLKAILAILLQPESSKTDITLALRWPGNAPLKSSSTPDAPSSVDIQPHGGCRCNGRKRSTAAPLP